MKTSSSLDIKPFALALALSVLAIFLGFAMGGAFGAIEDTLKENLKISGESVLASAYNGDEAEMKKVVDKSWSYMKRAHMHWGAIGTAALAQILLLTALGGGALRYRQAAAYLLGLGAVGYGWFWLLAAQAAPGLGSTGAAKEAYAWLGFPSAGACLVGTA
jgi:hypothetical protein